MSPDSVDPETDVPDGMADAVRKQQQRRRRWLAEGEASVMRFVGQIGVLGWIIVTPTLIGLHRAMSIPMLKYILCSAAKVAKTKTSGMTAIPTTGNCRHRP